MSAKLTYNEPPGPTLANAQRMNTARRLDILRGEFGAITLRLPKLKGDRRNYWLRRQTELTRRILILEGTSV
jgi:hypothetical protein